VVGTDETVASVSNYDLSRACSIFCRLSRVVALLWPRREECSPFHTNTTKRYDRNRINNEIQKNNYQFNGCCQSQSAFIPPDLLPAEVVSDDAR